MAAMPHLDLQDLPKDMPSVDAAARVSEEAVDALAGYLISEASFIATQITQLETKGDPVMTPEETTVEVQRLRRMHREMVCAVEDLRQKYENCKAKVADLGRFYGEEPKNTEALAVRRVASLSKKTDSTPFIPAPDAHAEGPSALRPWEGGLLEFSPFETLAAILKHFRHTLRELQMNPRKYLVLLLGERTEAEKNIILKSRFGQVAARSTDSGGRGAAIDSQGAPRVRTATVNSIASASPGPHPQQVTRGIAAAKANQADGREASLDAQKADAPTSAKHAAETDVDGVTIKPTAVAASQQQKDSDTARRATTHTKPLRAVTVAVTAGEEVAALVGSQQDNVEDSKNSATVVPPRAPVGSILCQRPGSRSGNKIAAAGGGRQPEGVSESHFPRETAPRPALVHSISGVIGEAAQADTSSVCEREAGEDVRPPPPGARPKTKAEATAQPTADPGTLARTAHAAKQTEHGGSASGGVTPQNRNEKHIAVPGASGMRVVKEFAEETSAGCNVFTTSPAVTADHFSGAIVSLKQKVLRQHDKEVVHLQPSEDVTSDQWQAPPEQVEPSVESSALVSAAASAGGGTEKLTLVRASLITPTRKMSTLRDVQVVSDAQSVSPTSLKSLDSSFLSCDSAKEAELPRAAPLQAREVGTRSNERSTSNRADREEEVLQLPRSAVPQARMEGTLASKTRSGAEGNSVDSHWLETLNFASSARAGSFPGSQRNSNTSLSALEGLQPAFSNMALAASIDRALFARSPVHQKECPTVESQEASAAHRVRKKAPMSCGSACERDGVSFHSKNATADGNPPSVPIETGARPLHEAARVPHSAQSARHLHPRTDTLAPSRASLAKAHPCSGTPRADVAALHCSSGTAAAISKHVERTQQGVDEAEMHALTPPVVCWPSYADAGASGCDGKKVDANTGHAPSVYCQGLADGGLVSSQAQMLRGAPGTPSALFHSTVEEDLTDAAGPTRMTGALGVSAVGESLIKDSEVEALDAGSANQAGKKAKHRSCVYERDSALNILEVKLRPSTPLFSWNSAGAIVGHAAGERAAPPKQRRIQCRLRQPPPPICARYGTRGNAGSSGAVTEETPVREGSLQVPAYAERYSRQTS